MPEKRRKGSKSCPRCGKENPKGNLFCIECGESLEKKRRSKAKKNTIIILAVIWIVCIGSSAAAIAVIMPAKINKARAEKQIDIGNKYLEEADYDKAEEAFDKSMKIEPKSADAATGMARVYNGRKQPQQAVKYLQKSSVNLTNLAQAQALQKALEDTMQQIQNKKVPNDQNTGNSNANDQNPGGDSSDVKAELVKISYTVDEFIDGKSDEDPDPTVTPESEKVPPVDNDSNDGIAAAELNNPEDDKNHYSAADNGNSDIDMNNDVDDDDLEYSNADDNDDLEYNDTDDDDDLEDADSDIEQDWEYNSKSNSSNQYSPEVAASEIDTENDSAQGNNAGQNSVEENEYGDDTERASSSVEQILSDYENDTLPAEIPSAEFSGTSVSYTYGNGSSAAATMTGRLTDGIQDLDGDGIPELVVVEMQSGKMGFRIYKVNNGTVEMTASQTVSVGLDEAVEDISYGNTQTCFIMNNNGMHEIGFASYCYGYDEGDGTPAVRTTVEVYSLSDDGTVSLCVSGTVRNGEGQENFVASLAPAGMNGSWNSSNVQTLQSIDYAENPYQDLADAPNPISAGVASSENGAQDLATVTATMSAESGMLTIE